MEQETENKKSLLEKEDGKSRAVDFDEILTYIGEFGTYQKFMVLMMAPFCFFFAFVYFTSIFITIMPKNYWCRVPELMNLTTDMRLNLSIPLNHEGYSRCSRYEANWSQVLELGFLDDKSNVTSCDQGWEFQYTDIPYPTVSTEFEWVCDKESYAASTQAIFFAGSILGGIILGWVADKYGRIPALVGCNLAGCIGGVLTTFATGFWDYSMYRMLVGTAHDNCFMLMYVLVLEYVGPKYRSLVANLPIAIFFGIGSVLLPWLAFWIADWKKLILYTSLPMALAVLVPFIIPESVRWLMSKGQTDRSLKILKIFESINKAKIPENLLQDFTITSKTSEQSDETALKLLQNSALRRMTIYLIIVYVACASTFDGLIRLSDVLGLDFFLTFSLTSATEIPSITLVSFIMDKFGRRKLCLWPLLVAGVCCLIALFVPKGAAMVTFVMTARFFVSMAFNAAMQWAAELFPTPGRASGSSLLHVTGYISIMITPFIVYLGNIVEFLPLFTLGVICIVGGLTSLFLPETMGRELPQTFQDGERLMKEHKTFRRKVDPKREAT